MRKWQKNGDQNWRQKQRHFQTSKSWEQFSLGVLLKILKEFLQAEGKWFYTEKNRTKGVNSTGNDKMCEIYKEFGV